MCLLSSGSRVRILPGAPAQRVFRVVILSRSGVRTLRELSTWSIVTRLSWEVSRHRAAAPSSVQIGPVRVIRWSSPGGQEVVMKLPLGHRGAEVLSGNYGVAVMEADPHAGVDELHV